MENLRAQMCSKPKPKLSSIMPQAQTGLQPRRRLTKKNWSGNT